MQRRSSRDARWWRDRGGWRRAGCNGRCRMSGFAQRSCWWLAWSAVPGSTWLRHHRGGHWLTSRGQCHCWCAGGGWLPRTRLSRTRLSWPWLSSIGLARRHRHRRAGGNGLAGAGAVSSIALWPSWHSGLRSRRLRCRRLVLIPGGLSGEGRVQFLWPGHLRSAELRGFRSSHLLGGCAVWRRRCHASRWAGIFSRHRCRSWLLLFSSSISTRQCVDT